MKKWRFIKSVFESFAVICVSIIAFKSLFEFFNAELIVDKIHYGFILTFAMIYLCSNDKGGNSLSTR